MVRTIQERKDAEDEIDTYLPDTIYTNGTKTLARCSRHSMAALPPAILISYRR